MGGRSCEGNDRYGLKARLQRCSFTALSYGHKPVMKGLMLIYNFSRIALYDLQFRMDISLYPNSLSLQCLKQAISGLVPLSYL